MRNDKVNPQLEARILNIKMKLNSLCKGPVKSPAAQLKVLFKKVH